MIVLNVPLIASAGSLCPSLVLLSSPPGGDGHGDPHEDWQ